MSVQVQKKLTPLEYLALEREAEIRSEFYDGEIFAMAGASRNNNLINTNIVREISMQMKGRNCNVYSGDMRVKVISTGLYTYPDIVAICGKEEYEDDQLDTLLNPMLIVEILSKSTESYDRGDKFAHFRTIPSLKEYVLISQDKCCIEHYLRQEDNRWLLSDFSALEDTVELISVGCRVKCVEIYDKVGWNIDY